MKALLVLILVIAMIGILGYLVSLYIKSKSKENIKRKVIFGYLFVALLVLSKLSLWMGLVGLYTTEILVHNGYQKYTLPIEINGKEYQLPPRKIQRLRFSKFWTNLKMNMPDRKVDTTLYGGYFAINAGDDLYLTLKERRYRSWKDGQASGDYDKFSAIVDDEIIKISDSSTDCIILNPREKPPMFVSNEIKGKRIFESAVYNKR